MRMTPNMQRQPAGDQRVVAAEQHALDDRLIQIMPAAWAAAVEAEVGLGDLLARHRRRRPFEHDAALEHARYARRHAQRAAEVLLDQHDGRSAGDRDSRGDS